jgi:hypothetical protein
MKYGIPPVKWELRDENGNVHSHYNSQDEMEKAWKKSKGIQLKAYKCIPISIRNKENEEMYRGSV